MYTQALTEKQPSALDILTRKDDETPDVIDAVRTPQIGDDVLYVLPTSARNRGKVRPAKVVETWTPGIVNLQVFTDNTNDFPADSQGGNGILWATSVRWAGAATLQPNTWHWKAE